MAQILPIPLLPGIRQDVDRTLLPAGSIVAASGVRARKGGIAKANGMVDAKGTAATDGPTFAGPCDALGYAAGREVAIMAGHVWVRQNRTSQFQAVGRAPRARPVKAHWSAFTDVTGGSFQPACAVIGNFTAYAWSDGLRVQVAVTDPAGIRKQSAVFATRDRPRIFAVGSDFILTMRDAATGDIYGATINGTTLAVSVETFIIAGVGLDVYDAAPFNGTSFLLASRIAATVLQVVFVDTTFSLGAFQQVTVANNDVFACCVYGTDGEGIWVTYQNLTGQYIAAFAEDLTSPTGGPSGFASFSGAYPAVMTRRSATTVWLVWNESSSSPTRHLMRVGAYDTTAALSGGIVGYAWHVHAASRPFNGSTDSMNIWLHTDSGQTEWAIQRRYTLVTLAMNIDTPSAFGMFIEPEFSPDERSNEQISFHPPECAFRVTTDESGALVQRAYFPALSTIRTQSSGSAGTAAVVAYEWETEGGTDARARQIAEVGGQGVVFGGGLQEIPSARLNENFSTDTFGRGVENGFLFAPAILDAVASAGAGLTTDALYQFIAVFEYITTDGLRVRSAPSNIVQVTPTGANLRATLKITTAPTTEREFSSPPNATAVHVYATIGGGTTFQRVTPDSGLPVGRGNSTTGLVTFIHSTADTVTARNEPLYSEQGGIANQPAPAHRFGWVGGGYAWVGGLFNPQLIERSKASTPNEPVQFTRDNTYRCFLPEGATGGAWMDGTNVVFTRSSIYLVPTSLGAPLRLPATVGCIDFRSIVELPQGLGFQSRRGYEILPRGFGPPQLISDPVQDELRGRRVISATVTGNAGSDFDDAATVGGRYLVLFAIDPTLSSDSGRRLVFDLDIGRWVSSDPAFANSGTIGEVLTNWEGRLVAASRSGTTIRIEDPTDWGSVEDVPMSITLSDARPFGVMSRGDVKRFQLLGEQRAPSVIEAELYIDGTYSDPAELDDERLESASDNGDKFLAEWEMPERDINAVGWKFTVGTTTDTPNEGVILHALGLEGTGLDGRPRPSGAERRA